MTVKCYRCTVGVARCKGFLSGCAKLAKNLFLYENKLYQSIYISLKTSNWEAPGMHCVYLVSIALPHALRRE